MTGEFATAGMLYAKSQNSGCAGQWKCHWCGAPCLDLYVHDDAPEIPGAKRNPNRARHPANPYVCQGCWLWRRQRISIHYHNEDRHVLDRQTPKWHSWFITPRLARAVHPADHALLFSLIQTPPTCFALLFLSKPRTNENATNPIIVNHLHLAAVNEHERIEAGTALTYTLDNVPHAYTVYEFEEALKHGPEGKEPGVRVLFELLGLKATEEKRGRGRPPALLEAEQALGKVVREEAASQIELKNKSKATSRTGK